METSKQLTGADDTSTQLLDDIKKLTEKFQLPGVDVAALVDWQRKDMETLGRSEPASYEGVRGLIGRRNEILQETLAQFQAAVKDATSSEAIAKQAEAGKQGVQQVIANIRELAEMEAQSRNNAWKVVQDRMQENLANLQKLLQPSSVAAARPSSVNMRSVLQDHRQRQGRWRGRPADTPDAGDSVNRLRHPCP